MNSVKISVHLNQNTHLLSCFHTSTLCKQCQSIKKWVHTIHTHAQIKVGQYFIFLESVSLSLASSLPLFLFLFSQYHMQTVKKTAKSWRLPLRKPTARAVSSAVKQQAASDDGECLTTFIFIMSNKQ